MKCDRCNGQGFSVIAKWKCPVCHGKGVVEPLTEQEYIQTCTTEQLAEVFMRFMFDAKFKRKFVYGNFYDEFAKWLKQTHIDKE